MDEFWYDDEEYVNLRIEAYYQRLNDAAYYNGLYFMMSLQATIGNMFTVKGGKIIEYPSAPIEMRFGNDQNTRRKTDLEMDAEFRNAMCEMY